MTWLSIKDNAFSTLALPLSAGSLSATLATGTGNRFPTSNFIITVCQENGTNLEKILVNSRSGDVLIINSNGRGYGDTDNVNHGAGEIVYIGTIEHPVKELQTAYDSAFDPSTGHNHDGTNSKKVSWDYLDSKPSSFPPSAHTHPGSDITSQVSDSDKVDGQHASDFASAAHTHTKSNITDLETITTTPSASAVPKADASGKLDNGWLKTGSGNGLDADKVDGKDAPSGTIVGTTDTQTLTNKTLTKPTIQGSVPNVRSYSPGAGTTCTLDLSDANVHVIQMPAGNITIALSNVSVGQIFSIEIIQDSTGGRTVTWFSQIKWVGTTAPTLTTTGSRKDVFVFRCTGSGTYDGFIAGQNIG